VGVSPDEAVFFGDSLNDQTMFKSFKNSVGVSNISKVMDQLVHKPTTILEGPENIGPNGVFNYLKNLLEK
jgi:hydroxymethylpyrimidine pyrophosphatase-like HAD family hydrolase